MIFAVIHLIMSRRVDDDFRAQGFQQCAHGWGVANVQVCVRCRVHLIGWEDPPEIAPELAVSSKDQKAGTHGG
jgi:hypothetical protein